MTPEKREAAIRWLTDEIRSLRMAPSINGCGPENWAEQLEIMEACLEAVRGYSSFRIDREAWKPCLTCNTCASCKYSIDSAFRTNSKCFECEHRSNYEARKFCPDCGRPLTEEAWAELEKRFRG